MDQNHTNQMFYCNSFKLDESYGLDLDMNVPLSLSELMKFPSINKKIKEFFGTRLLKDPFPRSSLRLGC